MNKRIFVPIVVLCAAAAGGAWYWRHDHPEQQAPEGSLTVYGNIDVRLVHLAFDAGGRIVEMSATEGTSVRAGAVLARLDTRRLELAHAAARAQAATQRERVAELLAGTRPEEIRKLEAELAAASAQAANLQRSYERVRDLNQKNLTSPQQSEDARTAAQAAAAGARALEAALALARAGPRREQIAAAQASQQALDVQAALAQRNLEEALLRAPADGVIQSRILEPGDLASPERPVYTLAPSGLLWARVYLAETVLGKVRLGAPAQVFSDSYPGKAYAAWVGYLSPSAEFTPRSVQTEDARTDLVYQARVFVCNPQGELRMGMPVSVRLDLDAQPLTQPGCDGPVRP